MDRFDNIVTLTDESGKDVEFEFLDLIEYKGEDYVVLLPCDKEDESGEVVILMYEEDEESESYSSVEDESVLYAVFDIFKEKFKDMFNFED